MNARVDDGDEALRAWQRLRRVFGTGSRGIRKRIEAVGDELPYGKGRDPKSASARTDGSGPGVANDRR